MTVLIPLPKFHADDSNGDPLTGGLVFIYAAGSTTKINSYTDSTGNTANANPVVLNSRGEANIWMPAGVPFKLVLSPSTDTDPPTNAIYTVDNIVAGGASPVIASSAPASPAYGTLWFDTSVNPGTLYFFDSIAWDPLLDIDVSNHQSSTGLGLAFGSMTGSVNAYGATLPIRTSLRLGQQFVAQVSVPNTGAVVFAVNGGTPLTVFSNTGGQLASGDWPSNSVRQIIKDRAGSFRDITPGGSFMVNRKVTVFALTTGFGNVIPIDNTIPQVTEGDQIFSLSYTPQSAANLLELEFQFEGTNASATSAIAALFQDGAANAIFSRIVGTPASQRSLVAFKHYMTAPAAAAVFSVRLGAGAATIFANADGTGTRELGGVQAATFGISEFKQGT